MGLKPYRSPCRGSAQPSWSAELLRSRPAAVRMHASSTFVQHLLLHPCLPCRSASRSQTCSPRSTLLAGSACRQRHHHQQHQQLTRHSWGADCMQAAPPSLQRQDFGAYNRHLCAGSSLQHPLPLCLWQESPIGWKPPAPLTGLRLTRSPAEATLREGAARAQAAAAGPRPLAPQSSFLTSPSWVHHAAAAGSCPAGRPRADS